MKQAEVVCYGFFCLEVVEEDGARLPVHFAPLALTYHELTDHMLEEAARRGLVIQNYDARKRYFLIRDP
jgi:hypothetical protein